MSKSLDTIYALSTPTGRSAIALIRISGKNSYKILKKISSIKRFYPNKATLSLLKFKNKPIDQVVINYFKKPKSFTGEEMVEINCHGSLAVISKISKILDLLGLRMAEPGEFTKRALLNNKLDLIQTESLADLINAETDKQRSLAISNLSGKLSLFIKEINVELGSILAKVEALIDFSEEDLPKNTNKNILEQKKNIVNKINKELKKSQISKPIRDGFLISVVGKPNTGKSSFVNLISNKEVSIVTSLPGTTTDSISSVLDIDGYKCTFIDTAGLRKHKNKIEEMGIKKTKELMLATDLSLVFLENNEVSLYKNIKNKILIRSKFDKRKNKTSNKKIIDISSITGHGINKVLSLTKQKLTKKQKNEPVFSRERHIITMKKVVLELKSIKKSDGLDVQAFKYREALRLSMEINQRFDIEDILDIVFKDFCIGK